jgi:hypothetical protein
VTTPDPDVAASHEIDIKSSEAAIQLLQKLFGDSLKEVEKCKRRFFFEALRRRITAYGLKAISIFGAIIVAAKLPYIPQTVLGLAIAAAVGLDQLTANHTRLLSVVAAQYASERLLAKMKLDHGREFPAILAGLQNPATAQVARRSLQSLLSRLNVEAQESIQKILDGVRDADLKALNSLYVNDRA